MLALVPHSGRSRLSAGLPLVLILVLLSACGLFRSYPDKTIIAGESLAKDQVSALLSRADNQFKTTVRDSRASTVKGSACFVAFSDRGEGEADGSLWCGPARQYGATKEQVWWPFPVASEDGRVDLTGADEAEPQKLNRKLSLARPDGDDPVTESDLDAPHPPAAASGTVESQPDFSGAELSTPKEPGLLVGPDFALKLAQSGSADVIGKGASAMSAADGEQFVYARFDDQPQIGTALTTTAEVGKLPERSAAGDAAEVVYTVVAGSTRKKLAQVPAGDAVLVVSAPKGSQVQLEVSDRGKEQTVDLRTGERGGGTVFDPLYRSSNSVDLNRQLHDEVAYERSYGGQEQLTTDLTLGRATLAPYDPAAGFAPQGTAWLCLTVDRDSSSEYTFRWSLSTFSLAVPGGKPSAPRYEKSGLDGGRLLFAVPPSFTGGTLAFRLTGLITDFPSDIRIASARTTRIPITLPAS